MRVCTLPQQQLNGRPAGRQLCRVHANSPKLPDMGIFSPADPNAEVYSPLAGVNDGGKDITERGGRYTSDFIWNTQWRKRLEYEDSINRAIERAKNAPPEEGPEAGTVSFARRALLDSMDVDLSAQLRPRPKKQQPVAAPKRPVEKRTVYLKPSQGETRKWDRRGRFGRVAEEKPVTVSLTEDQLTAMEQEKQAYSTLQRELLLYTLGATGVIFSLTWIFYTPDIAISYAVGAVGGLVYLRLLNKTVDGLTTAAPSAGSLAGQPRLLIPIILALSYNRWNTLASEEVGVTLQLLPMLVGFFTYKGAVVVKTSVSLWDEMTAPLRNEAEEVDKAVVVDDDENVGVRSSKEIEKVYLDKVLTR